MRKFNDFLSFDWLCSSYDGLWRDAIADLNEQLHVEGIEEGEDVGQKNVRI